MTSARALTLAAALLLGARPCRAYLASQLMRGASSDSTTPCRVHGSEDTVMHGQQIRRDDPCEICMCVDSNVFCWWGQQHCDPKHEKQNNANETSSRSSDFGEPSPPVTPSEASSTTSSTPSICTVMGRQYAAGAALPRETGTCLECVCGADGRVSCSPRDCPSDGGAVADELRGEPEPNAALDMFDIDVF